MASRPALELLSHLVNDLEASAFAIDPALANLRAGVEKMILRPVRMSGSGSSLFSLFDEGERLQAENFATEIAQGRDVKALVVELAPIVNDDLNSGADFR